MRSSGRKKVSATLRKQQGDLFVSFALIGVVGGGGGVYAHEEPTGDTVHTEEDGFGWGFTSLKPASSHTE